MPSTAETIIRASLEDLNILAAGDALPAEMAQSCLSRLNNMVSGWRTQYRTVTAIVRNVFNLVEDQQTYTIGLGGDFNVPRPNTIAGAGLWLNGLNGTASVTSITRSGATATVTQTSHGLAVGDESYISGANEIAYNGLQTVQTVPTVNNYTFTVQGLPVSPATGTLTAQSVQGQPIEIPVTVITDSAFQAIQIKNMPNSQFTNVYYNPTAPFGTIFLWPRPNTTAHALILYLQNVFTGFADMTTQYDWPSIDGYAEALQYQFDLRLGPAQGRAVPAEIKDLAKQTFGLIKRANNKLTDLPSDAALLTHDRRGIYNINSGTGG